MKICLACSAGGHLTEIMQLIGALEGRDFFFLTYRHRDSEDLKHRKYFVKNVTRNPITLLKNFIQTFIALVKERPGLIISTGAGVAIPACYIGRFLGAKVIFIETFCMVTRASLAGRVAYPIANKFLVQWKGQLKNYGGKAEYKGAVFG